MRQLQYTGLMGVCVTIIMQQTCVFEWVQSAQCKALQFYSVAITLPLFQTYKALLSPCELAARDIHCAKLWSDG